MMKKANRGFTLTELMIVVTIIAIVVVIGWLFVAKTVCQGNFWFDDVSVLRELQVDHPSTARLLKTQRNVLDDSVILVENNDGTKQEYCLDSSILFNYKFSDCANSK